MNNREQCEKLFYDIKNVAKEYSKMDRLIERLSEIVQNYGDMNPQDIYQWNQEAKMVSDLLDTNLKDCKKELGRIYIEVNKIYKEL